jgi:hypothetical protein
VRKIAIEDDTTSTPTTDTPADQSQSNLSDHDAIRDDSTSTLHSSSYAVTAMTEILMPFGDSQLESATDLASYPQPLRDNLALSQQGPSWGGLLHAPEQPQGRDSPSEGIQEACLLRYFIEDLSPWVRH